MGASLGTASSFSSSSLSSDQQEEETTAAAVADRTSEQPNSAANTAILGFGTGFCLASLAMRNRRRRPSRPGISTTIDSYTNGGRDSASCAICMEVFVAGENVCVLPRCKHVFHEDCLRDWIMSKGTCPLCRDSVIEPRVVG